MHVQINKEGRSRYQRKYFFPEAKGDRVLEYVRRDHYHPLTWELTRGDYSINAVPVADFLWDELSILCYCPTCGLQFYGAWYHNERFDADPKSWFDLEGTYYLAESKMTVSDALGRARRESEAYEETSAKIRREISEFRAIRNCPLCGGKIEQKEKTGRQGCEVSDYTFKWLFQSKPKKKDVSIEHRIQAVKGSAARTEFNIDASKILDDVNLLQKYIKQLLDTEMTVMLLQRRLSELYSSADDYEARYTEELIEKMSVWAAAEYKKAEKSQDKAPTINDVVIEDTRPQKPFFSKREPTKPTFVKVHLFNKKKALEMNESLQAEYEASLQRYNEEKDAYNKALIAWKSADSRYEIAKKAALFELRAEYDARKDAERVAFAEGVKAKWEKMRLKIPYYVLHKGIIQEIRKTEELLAQSHGCLKSLYSCGVIYNKYWDPVALASFYDYLASGRCTTLTGPDGAYNLYESEIRMDMVITKLDVVVERLEDIKKNQYALYSVMADMKENLRELNRSTSAMKESVERIESGVDEMVDTSAVIAHNTAVTAFYAKKNAELTNALGFMMALKG